MKTLFFALLFACAGAPVLAENRRDDKERAKPRAESIPSEDRRKRVEASVASPRAQSLGRDQSGIFVSGTAANSGYSPDFIMRGFPSGFPLFDGASHGFTAQPVILSTIDHVEFYKGPSAMLFGKALGGYGGAANYMRKAPTEELFAKIVATTGAFDVRRLIVDVNARLNDARNLQFRITGFAESVGSFVNFVRDRSFNIAPMIAFTADNGDRMTLRVEHNGSRFVNRDGVPAKPIFLHIRREFYAGLPANEHETPFFAVSTLTFAAVALAEATPIGSFRNRGSTTSSIAHCCDTVGSISSGPIASRKSA
jgi:iron complex outermembrane receptor protein